MLTAIFVILMLAVFAELLWAAAKLAWGIGKIIEPVIELYNDVVWAPFNTLHNKINPYKEN